MPIYDYKCHDCKAVTEVIEPLKAISRLVCQCGKLMSKITVCAPSAIVAKGNEGTARANRGRSRRR